MYGKATEEQKIALKNLGVHPPPSKKGCSNLLHYLIGLGGVDYERVALIVSEQKRFHNQRVEDFDGQRRGKVIYIYHPGGSRRPSSSGYFYTSPFSAIVEWDEDRQRAISLGSLRLLDNTSEIK